MFKRPKYLIRNFFIFVLLCWIALAYYRGSHSQSIKDEKSCEPILFNREQFYVKIDGETYPKLVPSFFNASINFECLNSKNQAKKILLWNDFGPWRDFKYGLGKAKPFKDRQCPVYNCEMTTNKNEWAQSDLIIIHMRGDFSRLPPASKLPVRKKEKQPRWVFFMMEPPIYAREFPPNLNGLFNLTATYKFDSDFLPYYYANLGFKWELNETFDENFDYLSTKTKFAVILVMIGMKKVSHCKTHSERLRYVAEMQKHVPNGTTIDIYGECGMSCGIAGENRYLSKKCRERLAREYMFVLGFENSFCKDYVTEKLFDTVLFDTVPVVLGLGNYAKWLPRSAYVDALDFSSPRRLVEYMLNLAANKTAYNSFFKWKKYIRRTNNEFKSFCDMCIQLHLEDYFGVKQSVVQDLNWNYKTHCKSPLFGQDSFSLIPINYTHRCDIC